MVTYDSDLVYWIWLSNVKGVGPVTSKALLKEVKSPQNIYLASKSELVNIRGVGSTIADFIFNSKSLEVAKEIINKCEKLNIGVLTHGDSLYPNEVKDIKKSPIILYYRGNIIEDSMGIAIVGSRRCTEYGKRIAVEAGEFLAKNHVPIVSGMEKGIGGYAHTACLKAGGYTLAILGSGLDICYPREHIELMERIIEKGATISEYSPGTKPNIRYLLARNRLIGAWCKKLLVVEALEKSSCLLTGAFAKDQNRQVFAAPSSIYSRESIGTNKLIEQGAKIYLNPMQLLLDHIRLNIKKEDIEPMVHKLTLLEQAILRKIKDNYMNLNELIFHFSEDKSDVLEIISIMELEGRIINVGGIFKIPK